jgi:hypothetical protein
MLYPVVAIISDFTLAVFKLSRLAEFESGSSTNPCDLT